jgi:hypothetical protein
MITNRPIEVSDEITEEIVMTALEKQFQETSACLNEKEYLLHKRSEIALSYIYRRINHRNSKPVLTFKSKIQ